MTEQEKLLSELLISGGYSIQTWSKELIPEIYSELEKPNWAPWLAASEISMSGRVDVFPEGQSIILQKDKPVASLSMNRINWNGNPDSLPTWDEVAGDPTDYSQTYKADGNTLVMMSMNVKQEEQGKQLPAKLIKKAQRLASRLCVTNMIGSFRPSEYGDFKAENNYDFPFWEYVTNLKTEKIDEVGLLGNSGDIISLPKDKWLRSLSWLGMKPIKEDTSAMVVDVPLSEFEHYKKIFQSDLWRQVAINTWECGEVGIWKVDKYKATYTESNVWGRIPTL